MSTMARIQEIKSTKKPFSCEMLIIREQIVIVCAHSSVKCGINHYLTLIPDIDLRKQKLIRTLNENFRDVQNLKFFDTFKCCVTLSI